MRDFILKGDVMHLARVTVYSRKDISLHRHDFAEIFWVESGSGTHLINNKEVRLEPGHLVMIRPEDRHTFTSSKRGRGLTIMNLAFSSDTLKHFRKRYFPQADQYFWKEDTLPYTISLNASSIRQISRRAEESFKSRNSIIHLDSLLLFIFRTIADGEGPGADKQMPVWLHAAIQEFSTPEQFREGYTGFVSVCGKNIHHINRTVKKVLNKSLSDLIAELRMNFAARQLVITNVPIKTICSDCGFRNLAHFYKTFQKIYQVTPSRFRKINQNVA
ncbi:MAG TPA: AraC family transcriptional regulator [Puia sp.]|nr:AraC family transcriptional regulator [Puia sp.]